jgi:hypothetical protein
MGERIDHQYDYKRHPPYHNTISSVSTMLRVFVGRFREVTGVKVWKQVQLKTLIFWCSSCTHNISWGPLTRLCSRFRFQTYIVTLHQAWWSQVYGAYKSKGVLATM